jgi:hypothetical protein
LGDIFTNLEIKVTTIVSHYYMRRICGTHAWLGFPRYLRLQTIDIRPYAQNQILGCSGLLLRCLAEFGELLLKFEPVITIYPVLLNAVL